MKIWDSVYIFGDSHYKLTFWTEKMLHVLHFQLLHFQPPRYSSLYRKEEPPLPFTYKSPRTAAAMRSQSRISPTEEQPPPFFRSTSYPGLFRGQSWCKKAPKI